jgi:hypothetical protein
MSDIDPINGIKTLLARRYDVPTQKDALPLPFRSADMANTQSEIFQYPDTVLRLTGRAVIRIVAPSATIELTKAKVKTVNRALRPASQVTCLLTSTAASMSVYFASCMLMFISRKRP